MSFELFAPECGEFLAVCHKLRTFTEFSAVDAENLVVGTGNQIVAGVVVGLVALPDPDSLEPDQRDGPAAQNRSGVPHFRRHLMGRIAWVEPAKPGP